MRTLGWASVPGPLTIPVSIRRDIQAGSPTYKRLQMKTTALVITAVAGLALAGCGSGAKVPSQGRLKRGAPIMTSTAPTTTTITDAPTGQEMACTYHGISANAYVVSCIP